MKILTKEEQKPYENAKICYICKQKFETRYLKYEKYRKVRDHCHYTIEFRGAAHSICNFKYTAPKKFPTVLYNGSYYDYHFIIKELSEAQPANIGPQDVPRTSPSNIPSTSPKGPI